MIMKISKGLVLSVCFAGLSLLTTGCGSKLWPFGVREPAVIPSIANDPRVLPPSATGANVTEIGWTSTDAPVADTAGNMAEKRLDQLIVYFAYDKATIGVAERPKVERLAEYLKANQNLRVIIEGHCDDRGSDEYNRSLSERRALAVREYLVTLGVSQERIDSVGYGEDRPALPEASGEGEHQLNRRAEFVVGPR